LRITGMIGLLAAKCTIYSRLQSRAARSSRGCNRKADPGRWRGVVGATDANSGLVARVILLLCLWHSTGTLAQEAADCASEQMPELRGQCEEASRLRNIQKEGRAAPPDTPPQISTAPAQNPARSSDLASRAREGCGLLLPPSSGAPGERGVIVIAAKRREPIDRELQLPGAPAVDIEAADADVCFEAMSGGRLLVKPHGRQTGTPSIVLSQDAALDRWLLKTAAGGGRLGLVPGSECADLLSELQSRGVSTPTAWVEDGSGLSRCERDAGGRPNIDSTKTTGYDGVIIMKVPRG
jgi:hypothetical protein